MDLGHQVLDWIYDKTGILIEYPSRWEPLDLVQVAGLLLKLSESDDEFSPAEEENMLRLLLQKAGVPRREGIELLKTAAKKTGQKTFEELAHVLESRLSLIQKKEVLEMMYSVRIADDVKSPAEGRLLSILASVWNIQDRVLADAYAASLKRRLSERVN